MQCEVSMPPRKGYVIPRTGHVQATLLNPNGMVVRMFVVAYDFRDMPAMCQTFVRQRILSFDENANPGQSVDDLSASEQMKLLRYAIHLRYDMKHFSKHNLVIFNRFDLLKIKKKNIFVLIPGFKPHVPAA